MREIRVSRIEPKFIEYQWKKARPDLQPSDPNQTYRFMITYNLMSVPHYDAIFRADRAVRLSRRMSREDVDRHELAHDETHRSRLYRTC